MNNNKLNLEGLKRFQTMFNTQNLPPPFKAIQLGHMFRTINYELLTKNANYKAVYNDILSKHWTLQNKFQYLINIEKALDNNRNLNYINAGLNYADWRLIKSNANYRALFNRVSNKAFRKGLAVGFVTENKYVRTRPQQGPTCWFHAIINGLLMSPRPRRIMEALVQDVQPLPAIPAACPTKRTSREWFLKYIKHRLQGGATVNNVFKNAEVIRASGLRALGRTGSVFSLRGLKPTFLGGNFNDLIWLYNSLFPGQFSYKNDSTTPLFYAKKFGKFFGRSNPKVPHELVHNGANYELSHSLIMFWIKPVMGHGITGFRTRYGNFMAFDSASDQLVRNYDWTEPAEISAISKYYERKGYSTGGNLIWAIYMRT